jgi:hypothetical protein
MKRLLAVIASSVFAAGVSATDWYDDLADGNSDLSNKRLSTADFAGVQPSIGDSTSRYHGIAQDNPDLFIADSNSATHSGDEPRVYGSVSGNPDLEVWGP